MFWMVAYLVIMVALALLNRFLAGKKAGAGARDDTQTELRFSKIRYGLPVPVVLGRMRVGGNYIEVGNFTPIKHEEKAMGKTYEYYTYNLTIAIGVALGPIDELYWLELSKDAELVEWPRSGDWVSLATWKRPMGCCIDGKFYWGTTTQTADALLIAVHADQPAYRGVAYAAMRVDLGCYPTPPACSWIIGKYPKPIVSRIEYIGTGAGKHANLVQALYWLLNDKNYMLGIPAVNIDLASFEAASDVLVAEGVGGSVAMERGSEDLDETIDQILRWIGGSLIEKDGKFYLKLRRYVSPTKTINAVDILAGSFELLRPGWSAVSCSMLMEWLDSDRRCDRNAIYLLDEGALAITSVFRTVKYNYNIAATPAMAAKVATRLLLYNTYPFSKLDLRTTRTDLMQEEVIQVNYPRLGFSGVYRVMCVDYEDSGVSKVQLAEEVHDVVATFDHQPATAQPWETAWLSGPVIWSIWEGVLRGLCHSQKRPYNDTADVYCDRYIGSNLQATMSGVIVGERKLRDSNVIGTLRTTLPTSLTSLDYENAIEVDEIEALSITSVGYDAWHAGAIALRVGTEVIYAQTVSIESYGYRFTDLIRGIELTSVASHSIGDGVQKLNIDSTILLSQPMNRLNEVLTIVLNPLYRMSTSIFGDADHDASLDYTYLGNAERPLPVCNIEIAGQGFDTRYTGAVDLTFEWRSRTRNGGAGLFGASAKASNENVAEHDKFIIEVYNISDLYRTSYESLIETWVYTHAQRVVDGVAEVDFKLRIYQKGGILLSDSTVFIADYVSAM